MPFYKKDEFWIVFMCVIAMTSWALFPWVRT